jgi:hypothetical protein
MALARSPKHIALWWECCQACIRLNLLPIAALCWLRCYRLVVRFFFPFQVPDACWIAPPPPELMPVSRGVVRASVS